MKTLKPALTLLSTLAFCASLAQSELKADTQYPAGAKVQASSLGIAFTMPKDWLGAFKQQGDQMVLVLGSNSTEGVGLAILMKNQTQAQVVASLNDSQDLGDGVVLKLEGSVKTSGSKITARYLNSQFVGRALAIIGPNKNHVVYFYAGPKKNEQLYSQLLEGLAASTKFGSTLAVKPPASNPAPTGVAKQWTQFFSGMVLRYLSSYNSGNGGGGMSTDKQLNLCSDGSFSFIDNSLTTINVDGANAANGGNTRLSGRWQVSSANQNNAVVTLIMDNGGQEQLQVQYDGQKTFVNGQRWFRVESEVCR